MIEMLMRCRFVLRVYKSQYKHGEVLNLIIIKVIFILKTYFIFSGMCKQGLEFAIMQAGRGEICL